MKKTILMRCMALALAATAMAACDKSRPQVDEKAAPAQAPSSKIAYVEVDSIMTQYTFCKEYSKQLEQKGANIQKTLISKQQNLEAAAANFQRKVQANAYTQEQAQAIQAGLQRQSADLQQLSQRLQNELQTETAKFNKALHDSLQHYLARYNQDKKYGMIFAKQGDNVLYADRAYDITVQVVAGLNKAYKPKPAAAKK